ncbi:PrpF domain-containing protein [Marinimicrobium sp. ABcell2]|uniref:PrpF domain-containing protein n=1 Tax=Marinimicrobium sp. ABcell2 TaxID=3069751 RepID=UPI0027B43D3E|nr:PrpF domain-containing protein [Marinimicrobium sp. ABcell2]MDQ2076203.1 PrpF domain-containing protein [Marinimicrobium sp. ABcell2]
MTIHRLECAIVRGGTTKGVFIDGAALPDDPKRRDQLILSLFGSPDTRQINGLGGGDPLTSKVAIMRRVDGSDVDLEYLSGEVGIDEAIINFSTMCGNLAAGAGLYAVEAGWVKKTEPVTTVRIRNGNTGKRLTAFIPIASGACVMAPSGAVDGAAGYGAEMSLAFHDPAGAITGQLLPTGSATDTLTLAHEQPVPCSIVDCGTLYGFVHASSFGLSGHESPRELDNNTAFKETMEHLREQVAITLTERSGNAYTSRQIKMAIVAAAEDAPAKVISRVINRYKTHKAFPVTGAICLSAAAAVDGTLVHELVGNSKGLCRIGIGHPTGALSVRSSFEVEQGAYKILETVVNRSARVLMEGVAYAYLADERSNYKALS